MQIDAAHWPWLSAHARRLGYLGPVDYVNAILNSALEEEREWNETLGADRTRPAQADDDDGNPL